MLQLPTQPEEGLVIGSGPMILDKLPQRRQLEGQRREGERKWLRHGSCEAFMHDGKPVGAS